MMVEELGIDLGTETDVGPALFALKSADLRPAQEDVLDTKADATAGGDKPEVEVRRNRKGYQIIEIERNFELRISQQLLQVSKENQDFPAVKGEQTKMKTKDAPPAKTEATKKTIENATPAKDKETGEAKKAAEDAESALAKEAGAESKVSVKTPDTEELQKAAALRFKKKGPAWGIERTEAAKKPKLSPIREELHKKG